MYACPSASPTYIMPVMGGHQLTRHATLSGVRLRPHGANIVAPFLMMISRPPITVPDRDVPSSFTMALAYGARTMPTAVLPLSIAESSSPRMLNNTFSGSVPPATSIELASFSLK